MKRFANLQRFVLIALLFTGLFRMRKLHLVRPDLIYYPLCVEVYC
jgi:hypothetical protein